jgi:hypothetical protein
MIVLKSEESELAAEAFYCLMNPSIADNSYANLHSYNKLPQEEKPRSRSIVAPVRLVPLDADGYQEIPYADLFAMERDDLLLTRRQGLLKPRNNGKQSLAREERTQWNPSPFEMNKTERGRIDPSMLCVLRMWVDLA